MAIKIKLKNSVVANKAPLPTDLDIGEVAINANAASPAAYIKDSAGAVVKLAGVGSVSTPDATDAVKGVVELATATETVDGVDTTRAVTPAGLKSALAAQVGSASAPATPVAGQVWVDSSTNPSTIKVWNGTAWVPQAGSTITSATAPITPATGQIWIDTSASPSVTKIWDGTAWVTATPDGAAAAAIANDAKYATKAELQAEDLWDRAGTEITPKTAGDSVFTTGAVKVGGTTAAPNLQIKADGGIVANTDGLVYDAATKRLGIGTASPAQLLHIQGASNPCFISIDTRNSVNAYFYAGQSESNFGSASNHPLKFNVNDTEKARIDTSGRFLVGTSTSTNNVRLGEKLAVVTTGGSDYGGASLTTYAGSTAALSPLLEFQRSRGTTDGSMSSVGSGDSLGQIIFRGATGSAFESAANITAEVDGAVSGAGDIPGRLVFSTTADGASSPTPAMVIKNNQEVLMTTSTAATNTTGWYGMLVQGSSGGVSISRNGSNVLAFFHTSNANGVAGSPVGTVSITTTATTYATSSDYRLKENVVPLTGAIDRFKQLKPSQFNFIADPDKTVDGFLAHEAQEVVPECATGTKDEVDADGNPVYQGIDQSKLVPLLTAALQEAIGRIEYLESEVSALKAS